MAYKTKRYRFKNAIEVEEYHTARYGAPGQKREAKKNASREQIERINQYNKEKRARHKLRAHFREGDYFFTLTYRREARPPDMDAAREHFRRFLRCVRKEYRARGEPLKWMRNIEVGTKNGWHIHMIVNRIPDTDLIIRKAWSHGKAVGQLLYEKGEFRELAAYITKTPKTDARLRQSSYSTSRNLPVPEPEEKIRFVWKTWKKIRVPKGF